MKRYNIAVLVALFGLAACGGGGGGGGSKGSSGQASQELTPATPGTYYTVLRPINFHSNGYIPYGAATFTVENESLKVNMSMDDDQPVTHRQSLHIGTRCPTEADDSNGDGFIDYNEAQRVVGKILMPLDGDINAQMAGAEIYPTGTGMTYSRSAALSDINADLWKADEDPSDIMMKLPSGKGIGFEDRVILIHGTSSQRSFPTSLASFNNEPSHLSLPVVCGVLKKID